jgi:hypothetical protein
MWVLLKATLKSYRTKLNIISPPFHKIVWLGVEPLLSIICSGWELDFNRRGRTLWAAVWSYTQDEIYWPIPGSVLDFCERRVSWHSQESNRHIAAVFNFLHAWASFFFNKHQEQRQKSSNFSRLTSCMCLSKVRPRFKYFCCRKQAKVSV